MDVFTDAYGNFMRKLPSRFTALFLIPWLVADPHLLASHIYDHSPMTILDHARSFSIIFEEQSLSARGSFEPSLWKSFINGRFQRAAIIATAMLFVSQHGHHALPTLRQDGVSAPLAVARIITPKTLQEQNFSLPHIKELIREAMNGDWKAKKELVSIGTPGAKLLLQALPKTRAELDRAEILGVLEDIRDRQQIPTLIKLLRSDWSGLVRRQAAHSLESLHATQALNDLLHALYYDVDDSVREAAAFAVIELEGPAATPRIRPLLGGRHTSMGLRMLGRIQSPIATEILVSYLDNPKFAPDAVDALAFQSGSRDPRLFVSEHLRNYAGTSKSVGSRPRNEAANLINEMSRLHLGWSSRLPLSVFFDLIGNRILHNPAAGQKVHVAFYNQRPGPDIAFSDARPTIMPTIKHGYFVLYYELGNKSDLKAAIREIRKMGIRASLVSFSGHGSLATLAWAPEDPTKTEVPPESRLGLEDEHELRQERIWEIAEPGVQIILNSCLNGEGKETKNNMANMLERVFESAKPQAVWSSTESHYGAVPFINPSSKKLEDVKFWRNGAHTSYFDSETVYVVGQRNAAPPRIQTSMPKPLPETGRDRTKSLHEWRSLLPQADLRILDRFRIPFFNRRRFSKENLTLQAA